MKAPAVKAGDTIEVFQWRDGSTFRVVASGNSVYDKEFCCMVVDTNNNENYATWDEENNRWEDGEI